MTIHELLAKFTPEEIEFQRLDEALISANQNTKMTKVTFGTSMSALDVAERKMALVLWIDCEVWDREVEKAKVANA